MNFENIEEHDLKRRKVSIASLAGLDGSEKATNGPVYQPSSTVPHGLSDSQTSYSPAQSNFPGLHQPPISNKQYKRNYKACLSCRTRKIKCDLGSPSSPFEPPCARCRRERKECIFTESRRGGSGRRKKKSEHLLQQNPVILINEYSNNLNVPEYVKNDYRNPTLEQQKTIVESFSKMQTRNHNTSEVSTIQGALLFLANAAGNIAKADERDRLTKAKSSVSSTDHRADDQRAKEAKLKGIEGKPTSDIIETHTVKLTDFEYIGEGKLLSEENAKELIDFFFDYMHPFYPYIPPNIRNSESIAAYPILLCTVLTIASRYKPLEFDDSEDDDKISTKNLKQQQLQTRLAMHDRLWLYAQRLVSQSVWGEASTRSIGTVFAFLLFTEWNPRAIHWKWGDYANSGEKDETNSTKNDTLAGIGALRRGNRMTWMLCGTSVRLAQDMCFMETSPRTFVATHVSETSVSMTVGQRSMLSQSLSEIDLNDYNDSDDEALDVEQLENDMVLRGDEIGLKLKPTENLKFTTLQKATVELLKISSLAYDTLYNTKTINSLDLKQILSMLKILSPLLEGWETKYKKLLTQPVVQFSHSFYNSIKTAKRLTTEEKEQINKIMEYESLRLDFFYTQLYIYSMALFSDSSAITSNKRALRLDELTQAAKFIGLAYEAAKQILVIAAKIHKMHLLRFMPVRWVTRIVKCSAFLVKCYSTLSSGINTNTTNWYASAIVGLSVIPTDDIINLFQKTAIALREASPDELHLCTRYSTILMYLCSEMKSKANTNKKASTINNISSDNASTNNMRPTQNVEHEPTLEHFVNASNNNNGKNEYNQNGNAVSSESDNTRNMGEANYAANSNTYESLDVDQKQTNKQENSGSPSDMKHSNSETSLHGFSQLNNLYSEESSLASSSVNNMPSMALINAASLAFTQSPFFRQNNFGGPSKQTQNNDYLQYPQSGSEISNGNYSQHAFSLNYFPNTGLDDIINNSSLVGLNFVDPFTELLEKQVIENTNASDNSQLRD